MMINITS